MLSEKLYHEIIDSSIEPYTEQLFQRSDTKTIAFIEQVIKSCERDKFFTIKVESFRVIDSVAEINDTLRYIEDVAGNKRVSINKYDYINLKASEIIMLEVNYYLELNGQSERCSVYIDIPRIVDKYYIKVEGVVYSAMFQIVDGSTYNNSGAKGNGKKNPVVQFKSIFRPYINYRFRDTLHTINDGQIQITDYESAIINDKQRVMTPLYFICKFGWSGAQTYLGLDGLNLLGRPDNRSSHYCFMINDGCYLSCPKLYYDNNPVLQSFIYTTIKYTETEEYPFAAIQDLRFWLSKLVYPYKSTPTKLPPNYSLDAEAHKGAVILDTFEHLYDSVTRDVIHLPMEDKCDIYAILRWIMYEFKALRLKSNTDITTKRLRFEEYIAAIYANALASSLITRTSQLKGLTLKKLKQAVNIRHDWIINNIKSENLIAYNDAVNDNDILYGMKYTYKGISGIGTKKSSAVPVEYRMVYPSQMGIVDIDSSSNSDPGMTGTMCPYVHINPDGTFTDFVEPNSWREANMTIMNEYQSKCNLIRLAFNHNRNVVHHPESINMMDNIQTAKDTLNMTYGAASSGTLEGYPLEASGTIQVYYA